MNKLNILGSEMERHILWLIDHSDTLRVRSYLHRQSISNSPAMDSISPNDINGSREGTSCVKSPFIISNSRCQNSNVSEFFFLASTMIASSASSLSAPEL